MNSKRDVIFEDLCFFNNFSASKFITIPDNFEIDNSLIGNFATFINIEIEKEGMFNTVVFGSYDDKKIFHQNILHIDFPDDSIDKNVNYHYELPDSWAFTTQNIYNKFNKTSNLFLLTSEYLSLLEDPRPLLLAIKKLFLFGEAKNQLIFIHKDGAQGYRLWDKESIKTFLSASGFEYSSLYEEDDKLILSVNSTLNTYTDYLEQYNVSKSLIDASLLILTTEDASIAPTGGIGTYTKNMKNISSKIAVLYCDLKQEPLIEHKNTFFVKSFMVDVNSENYFNGLGLLENIKSILYILPNLTIIEFQDYACQLQNHTPLGFRIVQAKQTGILPNYLHLRVFLHGNIDHIKYGEHDSQSIDYSFNELKLSTQDHYIFKYADEVFSPSNYLQALLKNEYDYKLSNLSIQRLPFDLKDFVKVSKTDISKIEAIVFIGKYIQLKGWPDFIEAINILFLEKCLKNIKKITALSPGKPSTNDLKILSNVTNFKSLHLSHSELIKYIKEQKNSTLFVVPSAGESFSFVTLELLLTGALFIGYNNSGVVEVVDNNDYTDKYFCKPEAINLAKKIDALLNLKYKEHNKYLNENQLFVFNRQKNINENLKKISEQKNKSINKCNLEYKNMSQEISIIIPVYNTKLDYIKDILFSINSLRISPQEVVFIDDGSDKEYIEQLVIFIKKYLININNRIISQPNKGLAGARNRGLNESKTKYTYFMDSDDVFIPNTLYNGWVCLQISPDLVATSGFPLDFSDGKIRNIPLSYIANGDFWKPIGNSIAKALSMKENQYIAASSFINTSIIKSFGGWDETDKSTWEDWAFYSKLAWSGYEFSLMPTIGYFYRNTSNSMSKTYNKFFGRRRIIRNIPSLSKLDANVVISLMNNKEKILKEKIDHVNKQAMWIKKQEKIIEENNKMSIKHENIKKALLEITKFSIIINPIKKYKAYKSMLQIYHNQKRDSYEI